MLPTTCKAIQVVRTIGILSIALLASIIAYSGHELLAICAFFGLILVYEQLKRSNAKI